MLFYVNRKCSGISDLSISDCRCSPKLVAKSICARNLNQPPTVSCVQQQTRGFRTSFKNSKFKEFLDYKLFLVTDVNSVALKYGLFGVAVGNPSTWVVSLITWMNSLGLPWWGAIGAGRV